MYRYKKDLNSRIYLLHKLCFVFEHDEPIPGPKQIKESSPPSLSCSGSPSLSHYLIRWHFFHSTPPLYTPKIVSILSLLLVRHVDINKNEGGGDIRGFVDICKTVSQHFATKGFLCPFDGKKK